MRALFDYHCRMQMNNFQIQIATAYKGLKDTKSRKGRTLVGDIETDDGPIRAYIKLLNISDASKEAFCAVLGRRLHLPIPRPYYVYADPAVTGYPSGNRHHIAFGLEDAIIPGRRIQDEEPFLEQLKKWPDLAACAAFDSWIANGDRLPHNLLYSGNDDFWLIDHDEALPNYLDPMHSVRPQLIDLLRANKTEHELYQIKQKLMQIAQSFCDVDWDEIRLLLRAAEMPEMSKFFEVFIIFLQKRATNLDRIFAQDLGIRQEAFEFAYSTSKDSETKKWK